MRDETGLTPLGRFLVGMAIVAILMLVLLVAHRQKETGGGGGMHAAPRSGQWPAVRKHYLETHPTCEACGYRGNGLQVHHVEPFHLHPEKELDPQNLITLCGPQHHNCHLIFGHAGVDYKTWNPHVREDVKRYADRMRECRELIKKQQKLDSD